jgi:O-antigen/teichoic acid export membrane protein
MGKNLKERTKIAVFWNIFNILFSKTSRLITSIILARLLFPEDFGLYGVSLIVIRLGRRISNFGFSTVLVQKDEINRAEIDTIFTASFVLNLAVFSVLLAGAPYFARFVHNKAVVDLVRVIALTFIFNTFIMVGESLLKREMDFKHISIARSVRSAANYATAIVMALLGFGVWSLIGGEVVAVLVNMVLVLAFARWMPRLRYYHAVFKKLYSYGMRVSAVDYLNYFINNVDYMLIGRYLDMTALGYYERAFNLMSLTRRQVGRSMNEALFSAFSRIKNDPQRIVRNLKQIVNYTALIAYPVLIGLIFLAPSLVYNLYGPKWILTIKPLQIMCISGLFQTLITGFFSVIYALDFVTDRIKAQVVYLVLLTLIIYALIPYGINGVAWAVVIASSVYVGLILRIMVVRLPFTLLDFWQTQKGPFLYGLVQIVFSWIALKIALPFVEVTSIPMFFILAGASILALLTAHLIFRNEGYSRLLAEVTGVFSKKKNGSR